MRLLTIPEVADILRCSKTTAHQLVRAGHLRAIKPPHARGWRVTEEDLARFIADAPDNQEGAA